MTFMFFGTFQTATTERSQRSAPTLRSPRPFTGRGLTLQYFFLHSVCKLMIVRALKPAE